MGNLNGMCPTIGVGFRGSPNNVAILVARLDCSAYSRESPVLLSVSRCPALTLVGPAARLGRRRGRGRRFLQ